MKLVNTMHCWDVAEKVEVGPWPDKTGWSKKYRMSAGACYSINNTRSEVGRLAQMMVDFHTLIVRDKIDPQQAHEQFLKIDEYREIISPDIRGAE